MKLLVSVTIPGKPIAQGRPRATIVAGHARVYQPTLAHNWKATAQQHMFSAWQAAPAPLMKIAEPIIVHVRAYFLCPKGKERKVTPRGVEWRAKKPDGDHISTAVLDAGNGVLWLDDAQVVLLVVAKLQAAQGDGERVELDVYGELDDPAEFTVLTPESARAAGAI